MQKLELYQFDSVYRLMEQSFPSDERRRYQEQLQLLKNPYYSVYIQENATEIQGFVAVWHFDFFVFLEHFAVNPKFRNFGLGSRILDWMRTTFQTPICLEVEPPETELARRRIGFYERNGFYLNDYPYTQPVLSVGKKEIPLMIMTSDTVVDADTFQQIKDTLYKEVYHCL